MPARRVVVEFRYPELPADEQRFWLIVAPGSLVDLPAPNTPVTIQADYLT